MTDEPDFSPAKLRAMADDTARLATTLVALSAHLRVTAATTVAKERRLMQFEYDNKGLSEEIDRLREKVRRLELVVGAAKLEA